MKILFLFMVWIAPLFASNLLTYNVYERTDRIDIMLSFDSPYEGSISQKNESSSIALTLSDLHYDKMVEKSINSPIVQELVIIPDAKSLKVVLKSDKKINVIASKTVDGFGLRIRGSLALAPTFTQPTALEPTSKPQASPLAWDVLDARYGMVLGVLFVLLVLLFWIRKRLGGFSTRGNSQGVKSWLFNPKTGIPQEVNLLHKKPLDAQNSVVLFEYQNIRYLVVTGNTNVLLEKFQDGEVKDSNDFEKVFEDNRRRLDEYLKLQDNKLNTYKNKASADYTPHER